MVPPERRGWERETFQGRDAGLSTQGGSEPGAPLPRSLPYFFASLKVAITLAFVGTVISETLASNDGIVYLMLQTPSQFRVPLMFAGLAVIAVMGIATYTVFAVLEARLTSWATRRQDAPMSGGGGLPTDVRGPRRKLGCLTPSHRPRRRSPRRRR
jgi:hypothetical protein